MVRDQREVREAPGGRPKKLTEAASYKYEQHLDELCRQCKIEKRTIETKTGKRFPDDFCIKNRVGPKTREGYGECKYPFPQLNPTNVAVWNLYTRTYGASNNIGMDGILIGRHPADVEAVAHALDIPWNETTLDKFSLIESFHIKDAHRRYEASKKKNK